MSRPLRPMRMLHRFAILALLAAPSPRAAAHAVVYLISGEQVQGEALEVHGRDLILDRYSGPKAVPIPTIAGIETDGSLHNGPFDAKDVRALFRFPEPVAGAPDTSVSIAAAATAKERKHVQFFRYGTNVHVTQGYGYTGGGGPGANNFGPTSSIWFTKEFTYCNEGREGQVCAEPKWIGLFGGDLADAMAGDKEAMRIAQQIRWTTLAQGLSLLATPVFLIGATQAANRSGAGGTEATVLFSLTAFSFANLIGWDVYEGVVARKAIRAFNDHMGVETFSDLRGGGVRLGMRF